MGLARNSDWNDGAKDGQAQQPASTGIIESIIQFLQGLLKLIFV